jgi:hypothetical protein
MFCLKEVTDMNRRRIVVLLGLALAGSATAHHSAAMFDSQKSVQLQGVVKAYLWTNPHCFILLTAGDGSNWMIEMGSTKQLYQAGWRPGTLRAGQELKVIVHPERDGSHSGLLVSATHRDGTQLVVGVVP